MSAVLGARGGSKKGGASVIRYSESLPLHKRKLNIAIAASGRFHLLALANELSALGHSVKLYSFLPKWRGASFGLARESQVSFLFPMAPLVLANRKAPWLLPGMRKRAMYYMLDRLVCANLQPCDVLIALSGVYVEALKHARKKYGAKIVLERASKHVKVQFQSLGMNSEAPGKINFNYARELEGYAIADRISIPSLHVQRSFDVQPELKPKLMRNPYGVDLDEFPLLQRKPAGQFVKFVIAGTWSYRKGCDLLVEAVRKLPHVRLLHVGPIGDIPFPLNDPQFEHHPAVDQKALSSIYATCDAMVLPSREEGLAVVQSQGLASGLPLVCSTETGGADLQHSHALADRVRVVEAGSVEALATGLAQVALRLQSGPAFEAITTNDRELMSWAAYGLRYENNLLDLVENPAIDKAGFDLKTAI